MQEQEISIRSLLEAPPEQHYFLTLGRTRIRVKPAPVGDAKLKVYFLLRDDVEISDVLNALPSEYHPVSDKDGYRYNSSRASSAYKRETISKEQMPNGDTVTLEKIIHVSEQRVWELKKNEGYDPTYHIRKVGGDWEEEVDIHVFGSKEKGHLLQIEQEVNPKTKPLLDLIEPLRGKEMKVTWCYSKAGQSYTSSNQVCEPALS